MAPAVGANRIDPTVVGDAVRANWWCHPDAWLRAHRILRAALECAGKAAQPNWTPATGDTSSVCRKPGYRASHTPRRRRFPLATQGRLGHRIQSGGKELLFW